jgi:cellulose synthase/poly-beta-1,6-N-acetylglucosamine synthase-like glycosyltransferase
MTTVRRHHHRSSAQGALLIAAIAVALAAGCSQPGQRYENPGATLPPAPPETAPTLVLDGAEWTEVMYWNFADGFYPGGWGWGQWKIQDGRLVGNDPRGNASVYFFPFTHGDNVVLETKVRMESGAGGHPAEAQLLTRDSDFVHYQSGVGLFAGQKEMRVRHTASTKDYVNEAVALAHPVQYGEWHVVRFMMLGGGIDAFVDDDYVYSSTAAARIRKAEAAGSADTTGVYPVGTYHEPHVAVRWGEVSFEWIKIYRVADSGFEAEVAAAGTVEAGGGRARPAPRRHWLVTFFLWLLVAVIAVIVVYLVRHYTFTVNRLFGHQRQPYIDIDTADWPEVTILVPAHNEEVVIGEILDALLDVDYPSDRLTIMPVNDRSEDNTGEIIDEFARHHPDLIKPYHRKSGTGGKAAALRDATDRVITEIMLVFDADYVPGRGLVKQLVAPFFDPEVGAVMGRVVPYNVSSNLLTRILDLERTGGYQVDQQARMNMRLVPQYGGTVGGVRKAALLSAGNWRVDSLAEDTDATYRLLLNGWKTVYQNRSECYEQVPESWTSRLRQISRWAKGHNQVMSRYSWELLRSKRTSFFEKLDGLLLLAVYLMSPLMLFGWMLGIILWYLGEPGAGLVVLLVVTSYSTLGNFAVFFQLAAATHLDGTRARIRLLPFVFLGFLVSLFSIARAAFAHVALNGNGNGKRGRDNDVVWHKTERNNSFNGHNNGRNGYHFGNGNGHNGHNGRKGDADGGGGR